jgi:hypothetical protein
MVKKVLAGVVLAAVLMVSTVALAGDVVATKRGKKYHSATCGLVASKEKNTMDEQQAIAKGLQPCEKCMKGKSPKEDTK